MPAKTTAKSVMENIDVAEKYPQIKTKFEAYTGDEPYLFVSYSHKDTGVVFPILDLLYDKKYRIWYDESCETGNDFRDELRHRIENAEAVLLFVSESSMNSRFCGMEIIVARENKKRLFPIYLDSAELPPAFQLLLENTHHVDTHNLKKLVDAMVRDLPAVAMDRLTVEDKILRKCEDNGKSIVITDEIVEIAPRAFYGRRALSRIILPDSLESIGTESFRGCGSLVEMDLRPEGGKALGGDGEGAVRKREGQSLPVQGKGGESGGLPQGDIEGKALFRIRHAPKRGGGKNGARASEDGAEVGDLRLGQPHALPRVGEEFLFHRPSLQGENIRHHGGIGEGLFIVLVPHAEGGKGG